MIEITNHSDSYHYQQKGYGAGEIAWSVKFLNDQIFGGCQMDNGIEPDGTSG